MFQICTTCKNEYPLTNEYWAICRVNKLGFHKRCKKCTNEVARKWYLNLRIIALNAYGGKCECCGEERFEFLAIDHIGGGGNKTIERLNGSQPSGTASL